MYISKSDVHFKSANSELSFEPHRSLGCLGHHSRIVDGRSRALPQQFARPCRHLWASPGSNTRSSLSASPRQCQFSLCSALTPCGPSASLFPPRAEFILFPGPVSCAHLDHLTARSSPSSSCPLFPRSGSWPAPVSWCCGVCSAVPTASGAPPAISIGKLESSISTGELESRISTGRLVSSISYTDSPTSSFGAPPQCSSVCSFPCSSAFPHSLSLTSGR